MKYELEQGDTNIRTQDQDGQPIFRRPPAQRVQTAHRAFTAPARFADWPEPGQILAGEPDARDGMDCRLLGSTDWQVIENNKIYKK